jgi:hypothetical protein
MRAALCTRMPPSAFFADVLAVLCKASCCPRLRDMRISFAVDSDCAAGRMVPHSFHSIRLRSIQPCARPVAGSPARVPYR